MRLRTTATALVGALALVLPTAGLSYANDHDDREHLGTLHYRFVDDDGDRRDGRIHPADNDTCYRLTNTTWNRPATRVENDTESLAVLFQDRNCGGTAEAELEPGEVLRDTEVRSALFKPTDNDDRHEGRHDGRHDGRGDDRDDEGRHDGRGDGRGDGRDDDDRSHGPRATQGRSQSAPDFFRSIFRTIG
ncbi:hypothetical protein [Streptomyces sp. NBC_00503]|uniref:hypothetical protein n=1 Tax=Streptomyces sp. NBC_00503 TaxID=2903659 RepID=UPI002E7FE983|nr:hypothetical protein [Streptomyces sp. NBC_00503]WUD83692.1 hypothetical protein OG490_25795 [Streptomyces sp. NBC_00503]